MPEQRHITADRQCPLDDSLGATTDLLDRLAVENRRRPDRPVRMFQPDVLCRLPFVDPVVPFEEIIGQVRRISVTGQSARLTSAAQRAAEHQGKLPSGQRSTDGNGLSLTRRSQWDVGSTRVLLGGTIFGGFE